MNLTRNEFESQFHALAEAEGLETQVLSSGPLDSTIAFVGEGPGEVEVRKRIPFVGKSGIFHWDGVRRYGLNPGNSYCTNVVKRQLSLGGDKKSQVHPDELERWQQLLYWELEQLPQVKTVVLLGNLALQAVTGHEGINNWRGSVFPVALTHGRRVQVVCLNNPAYPLREAKTKITYLMDCVKVDQVHRGVFKPYKVDAIINPTFKESMAFLRDLQKSPKPVSFDIEGLNNETACYGLANEAHRAMCINLRDARGHRFSVSQEFALLEALQRLFDSHRIIAQNGNFDSYWCWLRDTLNIRIWFDTLLAHHTLYPQLPHNLGYLTAQYTTHPFYKDEGDYWKEGGDIDEFWTYNCKDAAVTFAVAEKELKELNEQKLYDFFFDHVMHVQPHLVESTVHGVLVDKSVKSKIGEMVNRDVVKMEDEFHRLVHELTGDDFYNPNPGSWQQLSELFFRRLNLQGSGRSTDATNRTHMLKNAKTTPLEKEMLVALNAWKKEDKFRGTYVNSQESKDGRFRCEYKQYGVSNAPGRLSSAALIDGVGGNMQNQPVRARGMFVADPGCVLIYFDLAQAEAQVVSFRADIYKWKQQFAQAKKDGKYDCHRALASEMFKVPYDQVPVKDWDEDGKPTIRYVSKRCRHGLNYRMERFRLSEVTGLPYYVASRAFMLYHQITPELFKWWEAEEATFRKTRTLYNALGRRFRVLQAVDDDVLKSVVAFYPQSTIGDKITQVWYRSAEDDNWPKGRARICIDVHDNLVAVSEPKYAKTALRVLKKHAESPIFIQDAWARRKAEPLSIAAECKISVPSSWDDKTKRFVDDPKGLHRWSNMVVTHV